MTTEELKFKISATTDKTVVQQFNAEIRKTQIEMTNLIAAGQKESKTFQDLSAKVKGLVTDKKALNRELQGLSPKVKMTSFQLLEMGENITVVAAGLKAVFSGMFNLGKEAVLLAAKSEGVRIAFNKLNRPDLLENLQKATKGTVTELQLMQVAVKAENFRIPVETLVKGLEFAQKRARASGESVDYLVDSLVTGIGRKSLPILDNLQISTIAIQEELKKTGDFGKAVGNILERELKKMGGSFETSADKIERMGVQIEETKTKFGSLVVGGLMPMVDGLGSVGTSSVAMASTFSGLVIPQVGALAVALNTATVSSKALYASLALIVAIAAGAGILANLITGLIKKPREMTMEEQQAKITAAELAATIEKYKAMTFEQLNAELKLLKVRQKRTDISKHESDDIRGNLIPLINILLIGKQKTINLTEKETDAAKKVADALKKQKEAIKELNLALWEGENILIRYTKAQEELIKQKYLIRPDEGWRKEAEKMYGKEVVETEDKLAEMLFPEDKKELFGPLVAGFDALISGVGSGFKKMWGDAFSEANSLLEQFFVAFGELLLKMGAISLFNLIPGVNIAGGLFELFKHKGGIVKAHSGLLAKDEVPIIAQKGEMILNNSQQANLFKLLNSGGTRISQPQIINLQVDSETIMQYVFEPNLPGSLAKLQRYN